MKKKPPIDLPFLDINIKKDGNGKFLTNVYRKPTFTGLLTNFKSFVPFSYKLALIKTLVHRVYEICSTWKLFHSDIKKLENILKRNAYPPKVIDRELRKYLNNRLSKTKTKEEKGKVHYFKLPYIGHFSKKVKTKISEICQKYCHELKITTCFSLLKTGSLFSVKDVIPSDQRSFVVYYFSCPGCNASYVGETTRILMTRIDEHLHSGKGSIIFEHLNQNSNCRDLANINSFKIIDTANSEFQLKIKEAIHIKLKNPTLNKQIKHVVLNIII